MSTRSRQGEMPTEIDADFKYAIRALKRAAKRAKETAHRFKTPLIVWKDGQVKAVVPKAGAGKSK